MTISTRIRFYRIAWLVSLAAAAAWSFLFARFLFGRGELAGAAAAIGFDPAGLAARMASGGIGVLYATAVLATMAFAYRKTVSAELFFFALWAFSLSFEAGRILTASGLLGGAPASFIVSVTRTIVVARYFGLFALFCSSLYAAGYRNDRIGTVVLVMFLLALGVGTGLPLDGDDFTTLPLLMKPGFGSLRDFFDAALVLITVSDFAYAWFFRTEKAYIPAIAGSALSAGGAMLLRSAADPGRVIAGAACLALGAILFVRPIHEYYLWQ
ncbi:MAG: hypothetical protein NT080_02930 [Spirochaetes bacterium]|nr:hypothetical protein [Spirochaetota bacterium]